jgi:hypothetical protein
VTRHQFLAALHALLKPKVYLEIGVQHGTSFDLAQPPTQAYGVDPEPLVQRPGLFRMTSDQFFAITDESNVDGVLGGRVDLAFIDGMHLVEFALRDFIGVERLCHPATFKVAQSDLATPVQVRPSPSVVVFDDVFPRNQAEAARTQCPGDWTGDVWRIDDILSKFRLDLDLMLIDTEPTGTMVVTNLNPDDRLLTDRAADIAVRWPPEDQVVPPEVLRRVGAWYPVPALAALTDWWRRIVAATSTPPEGEQ